MKTPVVVPGQPQGLGLVRLDSTATSIPGWAAHRTTLRTMPVSRCTEPVCIRVEEKCKTCRRECEGGKGEEKQYKRRGDLRSRPSKPVSASS